MVIANDGSVGIGLTTPQNRLNVNGSINATGYINTTGADICIEGGNCLSDMGAGSGNITGQGTPGTMPLFSSSDYIGDSIVTQSGSTLSVAGNISMPTNFWIGSGAAAPSSNSLAIGTSAQATANYAVAIGYQANTNATDSTAIGEYAEAEESQTTALGAYSNAKGSASTAIGYDANALGSSTTALGWGSDALSHFATAIGYNANANSTSSTAVGYVAEAEADYAVSLGSTASALSEGSIAIGYDADARGNYALAMVRYADATANYATAIGYQANANNTGVVAVGYQAAATSTSSIAIGYGADATAGWGVAVGDSADSGGSYGVAVGYAAYATGTDSTSVGRNANANGTSSTAIGAGVEAEAEHATAIGAYSDAKGAYSIAIGRDSHAYHSESAAIGRNAATTAANQLMVGSSSYNLNTFIYGDLNVSSGNDVCITGGTCLSDAGTGGGNITGSGSAGTLSKFTSSGYIANSIVSESGSTLTISGTLTMANNLIENIGSGNTDFTTGGGLTLASTFIANGSVQLGDGGDNIYINSNDWDIDGAGAGTGFTAWTVDNIRLGVSGTSEIDTSSGNLILDSAGGTVQVDDILDVQSTITAGTSSIQLTTAAGYIQETAIEQNTLDDSEIETGGIGADSIAANSITYAGQELASSVAGYGLLYSAGALNVSVQSQGGGIQILSDNIVLNQTCTNNQILKKNAAGSWICAADDTGGGGGEGWTVSGTYVYNNTAGVTVGIGNNTPVTKLAVSSTTNQLGIIDSDGSQEWRLSANSNMLYVEDENTGAIPFKIEDGADTDTLMIDDSGQVGIGTTSPGAKLEVNGSVSVGIKYMRNAADARIQVGDSTKTWGLATGWSGTGSGAGDFAILEEGVAGWLTIRQGGNTTIDAPSGTFFVNADSDRVGIGTTSPDDKLEVIGPIISDIDDDNIDGAFYLGNSAHGLRRLDGTNNIEFYTESGSLYLSANGAGGNQVTLLTGGNVGIGTTSPNNKLHIEAGTASGIHLRADAPRINLNDTGASGTNVILSSDAGYLQVGQTGSGFNFVVQGSTGYTGIGTAGPSFPLSFGTGLGNKIGLYDAGSGTGYGFGIQANLLQIFADTSSDRVGIGYGNSGSFTETLTVKGGNVGIGETSPYNKLEVRQSSGGTGFGGTDGTGGVRVSWNTGYGLSLDAWDSGTPRWGIVKFSTDTPTVMMEGIYNSNNVIFNSGGNVGIGATSPGAKLTVISENPADPYSGVSVLSNGGSSYTSVTVGRTTPEFYMGITGNAGQWFSNSASGDGALVHLGKLNFGSTLGGTAKVTFDTSGNVGINTTSPNGLQVSVDVSESARGVDNIRMGNAGGHPRIQLENSGYTQWAIDNYNGNFRIFNPGVERMRIKDDGRVGIGTTQPNYMVEVNGTGTGANLARIRITSNNNQAGVSFLSDGTGEVVVYSPDGTDDLVLFAGSNNRVTCESDGDVVIILG